MSLLREEYISYNTKKEVEIIWEQSKYSDRISKFRKFFKVSPSVSLLACK